MSAQFYKATKEGYDGKVVRKPGEVFLFAGRRGSWMVPCDEHGNVKEVVTAQRETRLGTSVSKNLTREELREECRKLGVPFKATDSAVTLAELLRDYDEIHSGKTAGAATRDYISEFTGGGDSGGEPDNTTCTSGGTGNTEVL